MSHPNPQADPENTLPEDIVSKPDPDINNEDQAKEDQADREYRQSLAYEEYRERNALR